MAKFININNEILINRNEVAEVERLLFDVGKSCFEGTCCDTGEKVLLEYLILDLAEITLVDGQVVLVKIEVFGPEEGGDWTEKWFVETIGYIEAEWGDLVRQFGIKVKAFN